ncbi:hypothetical protein MBAV_000688 [Candidatus Magnetobacterium bavaricum]|uniref:Uncharacterized protein n=1 Tax=Candidatus Magnetobacterium bavaricum TaxID=29290 RepID=A0A0F3GYX6_9BACT|nr:hypothetical protein MBAV_000688 [Candidatus Magnetobacterium bavaricum]
MAAYVQHIVEKEQRRHRQPGQVYKGPLCLVCDKAIQRYTEKQSKVNIGGINTMDKKHMLIPRLKDDRDDSTTPITKGGNWEERGYSELSELARSLKLNDEVATFTELTGIPDVWARLRFFDMALYDVHHPFHKNVLGQWRGLLALIAFNDIKLNSAIKTAYINLDIEPRHDFIDVAAALKPTDEVLHPGTDWSELYIILFRNRPIGITSPKTLLCTAADYLNRINGVPWYNGVVLEDPINRLNNADRAMLSGWLSSVKKRLLALGDVNDKIIALIDKSDDSPNTPRGFIQDLRVTGAKVELSGPANDLKITKGIFSSVSRPIKFGRDVENISHVLLKSDRTPEATPKVLFIDDDIPRQWGKKLHEIVLYENKTLADLTLSGVKENTNAIGDTVLPQDYVIKLRDSFFTDRIFLIGVPNAFPGALPIDGMNGLSPKLTPLIPLKDDILKYISPVELSKRIRFQREQEDIIVYLTLPLSGPDGKGQDYMVQKTFRKQEGEISEEIDGVPVLQLWPNFAVKDSWNLYFSFYSMGGFNTFNALPYHYNGTIVNRYPVKNNGQIKTDSVQMNKYPEAMLCTFDPAGTGNPLRIGIILLKEPNEVTIDTYKTWRVGIDFGTTGTTTFYCNDESEEPERLIFSRQLQVSITASTEEKHKILYNTFTPEDAKKPPFLSVFHLINKTAESPLKPLIDGNIPYVLNEKSGNEFDPANEYDAGKEDIKTDLKWSDKKSDRVYSEAFLRQLFLQCAAEAVSGGVNTVKWKYSYPVNFSMDETFRIIWDKILEDYSKLISLKQDEKAPRFIGESESVASGMYFGKQFTAAFVEGVVCLDIGGGTTDISIWHGSNNLIYQTSLLFAGRNIFLDILFAKRDIFTEFTQSKRQLDLINKHREKKIFYSQADALIMRDGGRWIKEKMRFITGEAKYKILRDLISIGISGIFYYMGLILAHFIDEKKITPKIPSFYIAGNGSNLFHWIADTQYNKDSKKINDLLRAVLVVASPSFDDDKSKSFEVILSKDPKAEAAYGLTLSTNANLKDDMLNQRGKVLSGEDYIYYDKPQDWSSMLTDDLLIEGVKIDRDLTQLKNFVNIFNDYAKANDLQGIEVDDETYEKIIGNVGQKLHNYTGKKKGEFRLEPLFILELKELLKIKIDGWHD